MLKWLGIGVTLAILLLGAYSLTTPQGRYVLAFMAIELSKDPFVRQIEKELRFGWGEEAVIETSMMAKNFTRREAEAKLQAADFERVGILPPWEQKRLTEEIESEAEIYRREVSGLPCRTRLYIVLWYDNKDLLTQAKAMHFEAGCL